MVKNLLDIKRNRGNKGSILKIELKDMNSLLNTKANTVEATNKGHLIHGFQSLKIFNDRNLEIKKGHNGKKIIPRRF